MITQASTLAFFFFFELHPSGSRHPPSVVGTNAPLSKNKPFPVLPPILDLEPGGVGGEGLVEGPEERGSRTRRHPRARRSRPWAWAHMGCSTDRLGLRLG